jgi:cell wall-associated NlpC family hydrolase
MQNYIGIPHSYGQFDCIQLIKYFYAQECRITFDIPVYTASRSWMRDFSTEKVDAWATRYGKKVILTDAKNYDLMVFKSDKSNIVTHFGIYLMPNKMLHVEEGRFSCVEQLSDYWVKHLYAVYRHDSLV